MQRRQAEVARLRIGDRLRHGLAIADFADQDDVGCLPQCVLQRDMEGLVSVPTSRWLMIDFLFLNRYSIGSSMVRIWPVRVSLRWSSIDVSVVVLPEPVAPTISTRPRF